MNDERRQYLIARLIEINSLMSQHATLITIASQERRMAVTEMLDSGMRQAEIARAIGVHPHVVWRILN